MMKNHISKYAKVSLVSLLLLTGTSACDKDLLDTVPQTNISDANAFDTPDRIQAQVYGLYSAIKGAQFYGGRFTIYNEIRADEFIMNKPNAQTGQLTWANSVNSSTSEVQNLWSAAYGAINRIHLFLEGLEANKDKVSAEQYTSYVAEAKFLRALCYFSLVQTYAKPFTADNGASPGLPLRLAAEKSAQNNALARSTVAQVYDQIITDLNEAERNLPLNYSTAVLNSTRAHRNTAIAFKTRVYLNKGDYQNVVTEASKIVSAAAPFQAATGVTNGLEANLVTVFGGSYTGKEALLSFPMNLLDAPGGQNGLSYYFTFTPGNAEFYLNSAGTLSDPVFASSSSDARKNLVATQQNLPWLYKYKMPSPYYDYIPVIRYAEVLLNYAEASARTGDLPKATALVTAVRQRANAGYTFPAASVSSQQALINTILQERKIELLGEGFRVPDLLRLQLPIPAKTGPAGSTSAVSPSASNYIWPIPAAELAANSLMVPNP